MITQHQVRFQVSGKYWLYQDRPVELTDESGRKNRTKEFRQKGGKKMSLTDSQKRLISNNLREIDYFGGTGLSEKKKMVNEMFLIIGSGGVGGKALRDIKRLALQQIEENDVKNRIMFLCVDTAHVELDVMLDRNELEEDEIIKIPYVGARDSISPDKISPSMKEWVHPALYDIVKGKNGFMDGMGSSAVRQCGRVMFAQPECQNRLYTRLSMIRKKIANMDESGISDVKLNVIFLAGLAGGTGSGTIIDLGFLTRHFLRQILPGWEDRTSFSAYLFMPSASVTPATRPDAARCNQNAYAALKEIDFFMELRSRGESFRMDYGTPATYNMVIKDNLFDFCTLVEGVREGGSWFGNPVETARKITAFSIMNLFCPVRGEKTLAGAFLHGNRTAIAERLQIQSDRGWPEEANYHFNVMGGSACVVPVDILTLCAFKKMFDPICQVFKNHSQVTPQIAESFLQECGLDFRTVQRDFRTLTPASVSANIENISDDLFRHYGPYYMIDLTKHAVDVITEPLNGYLAQARQKLGGFMVNTRKWQFIINLYTYVADQLIQRTRSLYDVYAHVIDEMQRFLQANTGILTESAELKNAFGYGFCWTPVDLTTGRGATASIARYLDGIMNPQRLGMLASQFIEQMCSRKDRWTSLEPRGKDGKAAFDAAGEIRSFIRDNMADISGKTMEDYIVIAFTGDPHAQPSEMLPDGTMGPSRAAKIAARSILERLMKDAVLLSSVRPDFHLEECYHNMYLIIPAKCRMLYMAICDAAESCHLAKENIFLESNGDSIILGSLYEGVPAWALSWTSGAEEDYEALGGIRSIGIHIDQGSGGRSCADLPDLIPEELLTEQQRRVRRKK